MLESQGRLVIGKELLSRVNIKENQKVDVFFDNTQKALILLSCDDVRGTSTLYFVTTHKIDTKGRFFVPAQVRNAFPGATYLPTEEDGMVCILIFEHQKKAE